MKTLFIETTVQANGHLRLDIETDLPPGRVELVLVLQQVEEPSPSYSMMGGVWKNLFPADFDLDTALREIRHTWESEWPEPE